MFRTNLICNLYCLDLQTSKLLRGQEFNSFIHCLKGSLLDVTSIFFPAFFREIRFSELNFQLSLYYTHLHKDTPIGVIDVVNVKQGVSNNIIKKWNKAQKTS